MTATDVHTRLGTMLQVMGVVGILAGAWGGIAPFVGPTFNYTADGGAAWHWDLARGMLAALPGAAVLIAGILVLACARSIAIGIGRGGIAIAGTVMFAAGAWLAIGPAAWPVLWNSNYFVSGDAMGNFDRWAGFAAGPGIVLAAVAGLMIGSMMVRDRGRLVTDEYDSVRPVEPVGTRNDALNERPVDVDADD